MITSNGMPNWNDCYPNKNSIVISCDKTYAEFYLNAAIDMGLLETQLLFLRDTILREAIPSLWPFGPFFLFTDWTTTFNPIAPLFARYSSGFNINSPMIDQLQYMIVMIRQWLVRNNFVNAQIGYSGAVSGSPDVGVGCGGGCGLDNYQGNDDYRSGLNR